MKQRRRIYYSAAQRSEIWDRWQAGEPMSSIGRRFDRESSSVFSVISPTDGIRPPDRHRAKQALSLSVREEISRWLSMHRPLRSIARHLGRSASTVSREVSPMEERTATGLLGQIRPRGIPSFASWLATRS
jgi:DNA-binding CsgD family transcriptional regulator